MEWLLISFFGGCFLFEIWIVIDDMRMEFDSKYRAKVYDKMREL